MADVLVIGAGLSGLAAAYRLQEKGVDVQLFERSTLPGGHMRTVQREGWRHEWGPNSFLGSATALHKLAEDAGAQPVEASAAAKKRYLFIDGKLQAAPSNPIAALRSPMLPASAKLRVLAEPLTQGKPQETESVREFFDQRLGKEVTDRFVDAFVSGIYAGDISEMSVAAAFPKIYEMTRTHGSLSKAIVAMLRGPRTRTARGTFSFRGGLGDLPHAIGRRLGNRLHLGMEGHLQREGATWQFGEWSAPAVILATPAGVSALLLRNESAELTGRLDRLSYNPIVGVHLRYERDAVKQPLDGFGFLIPRRERVSMLGCIWSSALFDVCDPASVAFTCFTGGAHDPDALKLSDEALLERIRSDLRTTMGITAAPADFAVVRHPQAIPRYGRDHIARRTEIRQQAGDVPGLWLAGNYLDGVSMNDTVIRGESAAGDAHQFLQARGWERAA